MMTRERTALRGRRENLSREGEENRAKTVGLRFRLEGSESRCSHLTDEASRFDIRAKG